MIHIYVSWQYLISLHLHQNMEYFVLHICKSASVLHLHNQSVTYFIWRIYATDHPCIDAFVSILTFGHNMANCIIFL